MTEEIAALGIPHIYTQRGHSSSPQMCVDRQTSAKQYAAMAELFSATDLRAIGERIIQTREALEMTQADFARFTGISTQSLSNYEVGFRRPQLDQAVQIVRKTGVTLDWIYFGVSSGLPMRIASKIPGVVEQDRKVAS